MKRASMFFKTWARYTLAAGLLFLAAWALSGCIEPEPIVAVPPTATPDLPTPTLAPTAMPPSRPETLDFPLAAPVRVDIERNSDETCVECHTDRQALSLSIEEEQEQHGSLSSGEDWAGELYPLEGWEKVILDREEFFDTMHGRYGCITCHGGTGDTKLKKAAHEGMIPEPSTSGVCGDCHAQEVSISQNNLHANLSGLRTVLFARSEQRNIPQLETMMENHCEPCHATTCGQCHISLPARLGGGLVSSHLFKDIPAMNLTCTGCHGSRIDAEYKGHNEGVPGDIHWTQGKMLCSDCHTADEFHEVAGEFVHRYDGWPSPNCQEAGCHPEVAEGDGIEQHGDSHLKHLSCQACHSTAYKNCYGCHVGLEEGSAYFEIEAPHLAFKIGRNPIQDRYRPWKYVPVRHVPIARDSFAFYGENLLPNFDALPTWKYATPHNIQRVTPQTETCNSCHGNSEFFLTIDDVAPGEVAANRRVIVEDAPAPVD